MGRLCLAVAVCGLLFASSGVAKQTRGRKHVPQQQNRSRTVPKPPEFDIAAMNDPATQPDLKTGDKGSAALRLQVLLDRSHFSPGEIDGRIGQNVFRALLGLRAARSLPPAAIVDNLVWQSLNQDTGPILVRYTLTAQDVEGPFEKQPADMMEKAKLQSLGYESTLEALGERFHISPALLRTLNPQATFEQEGEELNVPNVRTVMHTAAHTIVVTKSTSTVAVFDKQGKLVAQYPCTSGSEHDPLPIGQWAVTGVYRNPPFFYNPELFWDAKEGHAKAKLPPGPNSPVGLVWIDLSKEHYGIHGTPEPSKIGYTLSHGCIRMTNWDALELADMVYKGVPALLQE